MTDASQLYVPGFWRCKACEFVLMHRRTVRQEGQSSHGGHCPHCAEVLESMPVPEGYGWESRLIAADEERRELENQIVELKLLLCGPPGERRQWYITKTLKEQGYINRLDIIETFGVTAATVSDDIRIWMKANDGAIVYNLSNKRYEAAPAWRFLHAHG